MVSFLNVIWSFFGSLLAKLVPETWFSRLRRRLGLSPTEVPSISKYAQKKTPDLIKDEVRRDGLNIDNVNIGDDLTISDLEVLCFKTYYPRWRREKVRSILRKARATAFTAKYAAPDDEDEKRVGVKELGVPNLEPWADYFKRVLDNVGMSDWCTAKIIDVGFGNGYAYTELLGGLPSFTAVDISEKALEHAKEKFPQMSAVVNDAEDLADIPNSSVDLYVSLRTYQSTLFDRRMAIHEAYRVLRSDGLAIVSVPIMFLGEGRTVLSGLIPPGSGNAPDMAFANDMVKRIERLFHVLNFRDVSTDNRSPFEIYIYGKR